MQASGRRTIIAHGRLAMRELRLAAARERQHGVQIMSFEQLAARLAGGLSRPVDDEVLRATIQANLPRVALGELDSLKSLPGMVGALVDTLRKAWRAGVDLQARAGEHPRIASIASLERRILAALPPAMMRPVDLVAAGLQRLDHVDTLFGSIEIVGITELSPCWRPLLHAIAARVPVRWTAGPRGIPAWLDGGAIDVARAEPHAPEIITVSAATAYHEAIEAVRWARQLIASGTAEPAEIAIASATPADYDDHFLALRADANLDLHFVHGVKITACREGQAAAALADILVRGLSQTRMRRLAALLAAYPGPFQALPAGWTRVLPADAPLASPQAWTRLLDRLTAADWPDGIDHGPALREIVALLSQGRSRGRSDWRSAAAWQGLGHLAQGAPCRSGRLARSDPGDLETGRRPGRLRLGRLDAGQRLGSIAAPLRSTPRAQFLALAARHFGRSPPLRSHHPDGRARSAPRRRGRSAGFRNHPRDQRAPSCPVAGATRQRWPAPRPQHPPAAAAR